MKNFDEIAKAINNVKHDIRAEALITDFIESGLAAEEFVFIPEGTFKRRFSTDINRAELLRLANARKLLTIRVNRDGIYDSLPEGLFHSAPEKPVSDRSEMSAESKKLRAEEKEARAFFLPFENEMYVQRIALELQERKILRRFSETLFDEIFPEFWDLDKSLDRNLVSKLVLLLHFSHRIAGKPLLMARCLETIIDEKVEVKTIRPGHKMGQTGVTTVEHPSRLGWTNLGVDFVCGENFDDLLPSFEFLIGPLKNTPVEEFLQGGPVEKFLDCFYSYFVPAGMVVVTSVIVDSSRQGFTLADKESAPVLGFTSAI